MKQLPFDLAKKAAQEEIRLLDSIDDPFSTIWAFRNLALVYNKHDSIDQAISVANQAFATIKKSDANDSMLAQHYYYGAEIFTSIKFNSEALRMLQLAKHYAVKANISDLILLCNSNIQLVYYNNADYKAAIAEGDSIIHMYLPLIDKQIVLYDDTPLEWHIMNVYNTIGQSYIKLEDYDNAILYFNLALEKAKVVKNEFWIGLIQGNIAIIYEKLELYSQALIGSRQYFDISMKYNNESSAIESAISIAKCNIELGEFNEATQYLGKAYDLLINNDFKIPPNYWRTLSELQFENGSLSKSYESLLRSIEVSDSLRRVKDDFNLTKVKRDFEMSTLQNTLQVKASENAAIKGRMKYLRYIIALSVLSIFLLSLVVIIHIRKNKKIESRNQMILEQCETIEKAHDKLQQQSKKIQKANGKIIDLNQKLKEIVKKQKGQLELKTKQLASNALHLIQKTEALEKVKSTVKEAKMVSGEKRVAKLDTIVSLINIDLHLDKDWEDFNAFFDQVHENFFENLREKYPELNSNDLKFCGLIKLRFDSKHIAKLLGITNDSVKTARHRIRKKMNLLTAVNFENHISSF